MEMQNDYEIDDYSNAFGDGWRKFTKNLKTEVTKLVKDPKGTLKQAGNRAKDVTSGAIKNLGVEAKKVGSKAWKAFKKFNPLSVTARAGTLAAFRLNFLGMSKRVYPSVKADGNAWKNLSNFWKNTMGGKPDELKKIIQKSHDKPILKKHSSFDGNDEYSNVAGETVALITAALPVIGKILSMFKKDGVAEEEGVEGSVEYSEEELKQMEEAAKGDIEKGSQDEDSDLTDDEIWGIPKPYFWGGVAVLGIAAIITTIIIIRKKK
jgi:hypothetical protein